MTESEKESSKPRILVVDDDPALQMLVQTLLVNAGMEVLAASTARGAAQELQKQPLPDLVLLDLMLPDYSGLVLLRQMRAKEAFNTLPVVILSALADPAQIREGLEVGADRYITKPYIANNLVKVVQEVLKSGRSAKS